MKKIFSIVVGLAAIALATSAQNFTVTVTSSPISITTTIASSSVTVKEQSINPSSYYVTDPHVGAARFLVQAGSPYTFTAAGGYPSGTIVGTIQMASTVTTLFTVTEVGTGGSPATTLVQPTTCPSGDGVSAINNDGSIVCSPNGTSGATVSVVTFPAIVPWLTASVANGTTTPAISVSATGAQTSHQVIGTCGSATSFTPCVLVEGDLPGATIFSDQNGTFGAHTYDFSGVTLTKFRTAAGCTTTVNGDECYDTTNKMWHGFMNAADSLFVMIPVATAVTNGDCPVWVKAAGVISMGDNGSPCGSGSMANWSTLSAGTNSSSGTFAASGNTWDFSAAAALKAVVGSGYAPTANGSFGYNSTSNLWAFGQNGSTLTLPQSLSAVTGQLLNSYNAATGAFTQRALVSGDIPNNAANTSGLAGTATALAAAPTTCSANTAATGILASGNATGCFTPANTTLSNLTSPVALNQNLLCATTGSCAAGSATVPFGQSYFNQLNNSSFSWYVDNLGNFFGNSFNTPAGQPLIQSGVESNSPPSSTAGLDIQYMGDATSHDCMLFLNGNAGIYCTGWGTATPSLYGVVTQGTFPTLVASAPGTSGAPFLSGGSGAAGAYGALNLAGGSSVVTGTLPVGNLPGSGATTVNGKTCTLGSTCAPLPNVICAKFATSDTLTANGALQTFATTCTIPANTLGTNNIIRVTVSGQATTSASPPTGAWAITLGGTTIYSQAANSMPANLTNIPNEGITLLIQGEATPSGSSNVVTSGTGRDLDGAWFGGSSTTGTTQPVALATNGSLSLAFSWTSSTSDASTNLKLLQLLVEQVN